MPTVTDTQAEVFCRYLLGRGVTNQERELYSTIISSQKKRSSQSLDFALRHEASLPFLDAYQGLFKPQSELRQRLYVMFAILEASLDPSQKFVAVSRSPLYLMIIAAVGVWAVLKIIVGLVLVKFMRLRT